MYLLSSIREAESLSRQGIVADLKRAGVWVADYNRMSKLELVGLWLQRYGVKEN